MFGLMPCGEIKGPGQWGEMLGRGPGDLVLARGLKSSLCVNISYSTYYRKYSKLLYNRNVSCCTTLFTIFLDSSLQRCYLTEVMYVRPPNKHSS